MAIYEYKIGMKLPVSAQVAGEVCEELEQRNGLTPHNLVEVSRPKDAPTHDLFEWDDTVAAEKYREVQARQVIRLIVKVPEKSKSGEPTRAFVSLTTHESKRLECCATRTAARRCSKTQDVSSWRSSVSTASSRSLLTCSVPLTPLQAISWKKRSHEG